MFFDLNSWYCPSGGIALLRYVRKARGEGDDDDDDDYEDNDKDGSERSLVMLMLVMKLDLTPWKLERWLLRN